MKKSILVFTFLVSILNLSSQSKYELKNNISIKPFNANNTGLGIGAHFERYLDSTNNFSIVFPLDYSFEINNNNYNNGMLSNNGFGVDINPGFRFYFVEPKAFNWYIGCSFLAGYESINGYYYDWTGNLIYQNNVKTTFGSLINVGFKGTIKKRFTYNVELGNGIKFVDKNNNSNFNTGNNSRYMGSISAGFGYSF